MLASMIVNKQSTTGDPTDPSVSLNLNLANILNSAFSQSWNSNTIPDGTEAWSGTVSLTAGAATIDMTNLTQAGVSPAINANTMHVRAIVVLADSANANAIQIGTGASNGWTGIGVVSNILATNIRLLTCFGTIAVDGTHKTLDFAGTGTQKCYVLILFGT